VNPLVANAVEIMAWAIPVVFAITVHEAAHAFAAWRFGDSTARDLGRLTLNPLPHISIVGTVLVPAAAILLSGVAFGWARPVPVNLSRTKNPRVAMVCVALAGPLSNLLMLLIWSVLLVLLIGRTAESPWIGGLALAAQAGVVANVILMVFNLLPVPPLDGGRVVMAFLPDSWLARAGRWHNMVGFAVVLALVFTGVANNIIVSAVSQWTRVLGSLLAM